MLSAGDGKSFVGGGGIDCGEVCTTAVSPGTKVTLLAVADDGSVFAGWSGGGCSGKDACVVTVTVDTTVTDRKSVV